MSYRDINSLERELDYCERELDSRRDEDRDLVMYCRELQAEITDAQIEEEEARRAEEEYWNREWDE